MKIYYTRHNFDLQDLIDKAEQLKDKRETLSELVIFGAPLGSEGFTVLLSCIEHSSDLRLVNFSGCQFISENFNLILSALKKHCPKLTNVSFANCSFDESNIQPMLDFIRNTSIHSLNIGTSYGSSLLDSDTHQLFYNTILSNKSLNRFNCDNRLNFSEEQKIKLLKHFDENTQAQIEKAKTIPLNFVDGHYVIGDTFPQKPTPPSFLVHYGSPPPTPLRPATANEPPSASVSKLTLYRD